MAYKFQKGAARLSGSLVREGAIDFKDSAGVEFNLRLGANDGIVDIARHNGSDEGLKLGGTLVTATATELSLMDGGTARGTTAVADGDGLVTNDNGTMRQTSVQTFQTYFDANSVGGTGIVTVGALDAGSISSNFGAINNGGSAITTTGLGSFGSLDVDDVLINGSTIGHTDDTDLLTLANGALTVKGTITTGVDDAGFDVKFFGDTASAYMLWDTSADDLILAGAAGLVVPDGQLTLEATAVTSTAAELNLLDTSAAGIIKASKAAIYSSSGSLNTQGLAVVDGAYNLTIASHDGSNGLVLGSTLVTSNAAELNLLAGSSAGTAVASKAAIYNATKGLNAVQITSSWYSGGKFTSEVDLNSNNMIGIADLDVAGAAAFLGNVDLGNATTDTITCTGQFDSDLIPSTDSSRDLGTSAKQWAEAHIDTGHIDTVTATNVDGILGANTAAAATVTTLSATGDVDLGDNTGDTITATGRFDSSLVPSSDSARDLGTTALRWSTIYVDSIVGADIANDVESYGAVPLSYTISGATDFALLETSAQTYTLPAAATGKIVHVKLSGSTHTCTVAAAGGDWVEGAANVLLESTGSAVTFVAQDGVHWHII